MFLTWLRFLLHLNKRKQTCFWERCETCQECLASRKSCWWRENRSAWGGNWVKSNKTTVIPEYLFAFLGSKQLPQEYFHLGCFLYIDCLVLPMFSQDSLLVSLSLIASLDHWYLQFHWSTFQSLLLFLSVFEEPVNRSHSYDLQDPQLRFSLFCLQDPESAEILVCVFPNISWFVKFLPGVSHFCSLLN